MCWQSEFNTCLILDTYNNYLSLSFISTTSKFIDAALEKLQQKAKDGDESGEMSVLEKLLQIDRNLAIMMSLDMLMAGVDTVSWGVVIGDSSIHPQLL